MSDRFKEFAYAKENGNVALNLHPGQEKAMYSNKRVILVLSGTQGGKCLDTKSRVLLTSGERKLIGEMEVGDEVFCLKEDTQKIIKSKVVQTHDTGHQEIIRIVTKTGREIRCTPWHPLYSESGWSRADSFSIGGWVAVPRSIEVKGKLESSLAEARMIGYFLGDGCTGNRKLRFSNIENSVIEDFSSCLPNCYELVDGGRPADWCVRRSRQYSGEYNLPDKIAEWGFDCLAKHKRIPDFVFQSTSAVIGHVLGALFACDGWIDDKGFGIGLASKGMIQDIQHLLLRFGILSRTRYKPVKLNGKVFDSWALDVRDYDSLVKLSAAVWMPNKSAKLDALIERKSSMRANGKDQMPDFPIEKCSGHSRPRHSVVSRAKAKEMFETFGCGEVQAFSDIYWDQVDSIEELGEQQTYDITVEGSHNFIADDIFAHNTCTGPFWLLNEIIKRGPGDYMIVTPTYRLLEKKLLDEFLRLFVDWMGLGKFTSNPSPKFLFSEEGSRKLFGHSGVIRTQVFFGYAQKPNSLESATIKGAWLDECGQEEFKLGSWQALQRRAAIHTGRFYLTTTPYNLGWLKQQLYDPWLKAPLVIGSETEHNHPEIEVVNFRSIDNPSFPVDEYYRAKANMPFWLWNMFYNGVFTKPLGLIYDCFDEETCKRPLAIPPAHWPRYVGVDFGGVNTAAVFLAQCPDTGLLYLYNTYHPAEKRTIEKHAESIKKEAFGFIDRAVGGARNEGQWRDQFAEEGVFIEEPPIADVEVGIARTYGFLKRNQIIVRDNLDELLEEIFTYSRKSDEAGNVFEEINNKNDFHHLDALRYITSALAVGNEQFASVAGGERSPMIEREIELAVALRGGKLGRTWDSLPSAITMPEKRWGFR